MKQIVRSIPDIMNLARNMYDIYEHKLANETKRPLQLLVGPGQWEELYVVHYIKEI